MPDPIGSNPMATVKYAAHISDIRGSIGSTTYSRNTLGSFMRSKFRPRDPKTAAQLNQRAIHTQAVYAWKNTATTAQREAWNALALTTSLINRAGIEYHPTGFNLFVRMFDFVKGTGGTPLLPAPDSATDTPAPFQLSLEVSAGSGALLLDDDSGWCTDRTGRVYMWLSPLLPNSRFSFYSGWEHAFSQSIAYCEGLLTTGWFYTWDPLAVDQRLQVMWRSFAESGDGYAVSDYAWTNLAATAA